MAAVYRIVEHLKANRSRLQVKKVFSELQT